MTSLDLIIVGIFILSVLAIGLTAKSRAKTTEDYFLAGRDLPWYQIGFSLFATNFSASAIIGLTGAAYITGIAIYNYEWIGIIAIIFFALFLVGVVRGSQVYTIAQFLDERYDKRIKYLYSLFLLFLIIFIDMAASLYAGGLLLHELFPQVSMSSIIFIIMIIVAIYSLVGGIGSISKTDILQTNVIILGAMLIAFFAFREAGGMAGIRQSAPSEFLSLVRPLDDRAVPWPGLLLGIPILGAYFWLTSQNMAQFVLSARSETDAARGLFMAGFLKLLVLFIIILPGVAAIGFLPDIPEPDRIYPSLITQLLPTGILGLVLAGFIASLMSNTDSTLHAASTIITMDFVRPAFGNISNAQLVWVGRATSLVIIGISAIWAPKIGDFGTLFEYIQGLLSYVVTPFVVVYLGGIFWKHSNARGAFWTLIFGSSSAIMISVLQALNIIDLHYLYVPFPVALISLFCLWFFSRKSSVTLVDARLLWDSDVLKKMSRPDLIIAALLCGAIFVQVWLFR